METLPPQPSPPGATVRNGGVHYHVWCPVQQSLDLVITDMEGTTRTLATVRDGRGCHDVWDGRGRPGDRYQYRFPDGRTYPDPASRAQESDVRSPSVVVDPHAFAWTDGGWIRPDFRDLVIYEIHVGAFTPEGTFRAAAEKLPLLKELGVNAIELMPVADFPGSRNWGYDGVLLFAPARAYGHPDDLRFLVNAAHRLGIAVIQDVVYNHLGPDGNCLGAYAPAYFDASKHTPWGAGLDFDGRGSSMVRHFFASNAEHWMEEYHMDGLRLDATHWILDASQEHFLAEISRRVHARGGYVIAEDERNEVKLVEAPERGGYACDAVWADDYHHSVRVSQTGEKHSYLQDFNGTLEETVEALEHGWLFRGQKKPLHGTVPRGTEVAHVPPSRLIHCISNHDQTGNRAFGDRIHSLVSPESYRAISMMLCLTPYTPMLFMGQEWACSSPFQFFTDHEEELGRLVTEGRRKEFFAFPEFNDPSRLQEIPDPQDAATFLRSKLVWDEREGGAHGQCLELYRRCLRLRHEESSFRPYTRSGWQAGILQRGAGWLRFEGPDHDHLLIFHLWPGAEPLDISFDRLPWSRRIASWELVLSSNDAAFGGTGACVRPEAGGYVFGAAETLLLRAVIDRASI